MNRSAGFRLFGRERQPGRQFGGLPCMVWSFPRPLLSVSFDSDRAGSLPLLDETPEGGETDHQS
jgi:hypothetical protein